MFLPGWPPCFYIPKALNSLVFSHGTLTQHLALLTTSFSYNYCPLFIGSCPPLILTCGSSTSSRFYLRPSTLSFRKSLFFLWLAHVLPCASNSQISLQPSPLPLQMNSDTHCLPTSLISSTPQTTNSIRPNPTWSSVPYHTVGTTSPIKNHPGTHDFYLSLPSTETSEYLESAHSSPIFTARSQAELLPKHS